MSKKPFDLDEFQSMWNDACDCFEGDRAGEPENQAIALKWENEGLTGWEMAEVLFKIMKERGYAK